jgi:hypothetical protein
MGSLLSATDVTNGGARDHGIYGDASTPPARLVGTHFMIDRRQDGAARYEFVARVVAAFGVTGARHEAFFLGAESRHTLVNDGQSCPDLFGVRRGPP